MVWDRGEDIGAPRLPSYRPSGVSCRSTCVPSPGLSRVQSHDAVGVGECHALSRRGLGVLQVAPTTTPGALLETTWLCLFPHSPHKASPTVLPIHQTRCHSLTHHTKIRHRDDLCKKSFTNVLIFQQSYCNGLKRQTDGLLQAIR